MLALYTPDGHRIYIMKAWIQAVRLPIAHEYKGLNVGSVLVLSGYNQAVREDPELVSELILKA